MPKERNLPSSEIKSAFQLPVHLYRVTRANERPYGLTHHRTFGWQRASRMASLLIFSAIVALRLNRVYYGLLLANRHNQL